MKKTYFCTSDIHGYYDLFIEALTREGFDKNNPSHILIVAGDIFDRGEQSLEVYNFLKSLPKERRILIRGNHEYLLRDLVARKRPKSYDESNGTYGTLFQLANIGYKKESEMIHDYYRDLATNNEVGNPKSPVEIESKYAELRKKLYIGKVQEVLDWIFSDEWVNYYELDNYIFVHSFIPTPIPWDLYSPTRGEPIYREDWRNATPTEWEDATWVCPWSYYKAGLFKPEEEKGKILVCGHWAAYDFKRHLGGKQFKRDKLDYSPYISKHLIALDATTYASHKINIYKIEKEDAD